MTWTIVLSEWSLCFIEKVQVEFGAVCIIFYFRQACRPRDSRADAANQILHYWDVRGFLKLAIINANDRLPEPRVWRIQYTTLSHIVRIFRTMQQISCRTVWQKCAAWIKNINTFFYIVWDYLNILWPLNYLQKLPGTGRNSFQWQILGRKPI